MELKIYEEIEKSEVVRLKLKRTNDGSIALVVVDEKGNTLDHGIILDIQPNGTLYLYQDIDIEGIQRELSGVIKIERQD